MGSSSRLLVLDGDDAAHATAARVAESLGVPVRHTHGVAPFLRELEAWRPTHVMLDLNLSEMDGIEVVRHLAATGYRCSVIITSDLDKRVVEAARRSALGHGLRVDVLPRPIDAGALRRLLVDRRPGEHARERAHEHASRVTDEVDVDAHDLARALDVGDVGVVYQPKVECCTGAVVAVEALARWHHPQRGVIMPDAFVPLAEESDLIDRLTDVVFREAIAWFSANLVTSSLVLCLNLSARSLRDVAVADRIERLCRDASLDPSRVMLEVTETSSVPDQLEARDVLTRLRIKGMALALDDFGSGHSSLVQLVRQPFSELKIERDFVRRSVESADARSVIRAVVGLGRSLDMRVIAEGVENEEVWETIMELGCDVAQGHFIAPPMEGHEALEWLEARAPLLRDRPPA